MWKWLSSSRWLASFSPFWPKTKVWQIKTKVFQGSFLLRVGPLSMGWLNKFKARSGCVYTMDGPVIHLVFLKRNQPYIRRGRPFKEFIKPNSPRKDYFGFSGTLSDSLCVWCLYIYLTSFLKSLSLVAWGENSWGCSVIKSTFALEEDQGLVPSTHMVSHNHSELQLYGVFDPMPSSNFCRHCLYMIHLNTCRLNTHTQ